MRDHVKRKEVAKCDVCGGYIKPDIVFFGESVRCSLNSLASLRLNYLSLQATSQIQSCRPEHLLR
jgi:NAD-dependent SIR2 family protein deacetylase